MNAEHFQKQTMTKISYSNLRTGGCAWFIRTVFTVAVVVVDLIEGDEVTAVEAFEVHGGVVERGVLRPHPVRPDCHASSQY